MMDQSRVMAALEKPFGTAIVDRVALCQFEDGQWQTPQVIHIDQFGLRPDAHVLHYASTCFEGMKAHVWEDGSLHVFRLNDHLQRLQQSACGVCLPPPSMELMQSMIIQLLNQIGDWHPPAGHAVYLRPTLIGTDAGIAGASSPPSKACFFILAAPVTDFFRNSMRPMRLALVEDRPRCTPGFGMFKAGSNYAACMPVYQRVKQEYDVDQVLFASGGIVQETGTANFFLAADNRLVTKALDADFLHGITRNSVIQLAASSGYQVEEVALSIERLTRLLPEGEAFLTGTAYGLAPVCNIVVRGKKCRTKLAEAGPVMRHLRRHLIQIQQGKRPDPFGWMTKVV